MSWLLRILLLCFASIAWSDDDWESDYDDDWQSEYDDDWEDEYELTKIVYGGLEIECDLGCGTLAADPEYAAKDETFLACVDSTVNLGAGIYDADLDTWTAIPEPWSHTYFDEVSKEYSVYDWRASAGDRFYRDVSLENHGSFLEAVSIFYEDLAFYHQQTLRSNHQLVQQLYPNGVPLATQTDDEWLHFSHLEQYTQEKYEKAQVIAAEAFRKIDAHFMQIFVLCLEHHQAEGIAFHQALEHFLADDVMAALERIRFIIELSEKKGFNDQLLSKLYLLQGQVQSECCLFADAIVALTAALQKDPALKEAYFERAVAYFEQGRFEEALQDYLESGYQSASAESRIQWGERTEIGAGIAVGILKGANKAVEEFVPGLLSSLRGVSQGLWAFCLHPVGASQDFANAAVQCVEYIKNQSARELMEALVPELKELIERYDSLSAYEKGTMIGTLVGQYGIDIFFGNTAMKAVKHLRDLKRANQLMTLEALASRENSLRIVEASFSKSVLRKEKLKGYSLKIQADKQGKHIEGHRNYKLDRQKSIFEHPEPQRLIDKYAGTGIRDPNRPNQELVNFGEQIGYYVERRTGRKFATSSGKIHYAKDGVHIVPTLRF